MAISKRKGNVEALTSKKYDIENSVLKSFMRVVKDRQLYPLYLSQMNVNGIVGYILGKRKGRFSNGDNPFTNTKTRDELIRQLYDISEKMSKSQNGKGIASADKYDHVTMAINHLLHFFLEGKTRDVSMDDMVSIGEEIYALSCHALFGDSLEDMEAQKEAEEARKREEAERVRREMELIAKGKKKRRSDDGGWGSIDTNGIALGGPNPFNMERPVWLDDALNGANEDPDMFDEGDDEWV